MKFPTEWKVIKNMFQTPNHQPDIDFTPINQVLITINHYYPLLATIITTVIIAISHYYSDY